MYLVAIFNPNRLDMVPDLGFSKVFSHGVLLCSGLSPPLFLIYINDLLIHVSPSILLFDGDCVIYGEINGTNLQTLQSIISTYHWCNKWLTKLGTNKCK